MRVDRPQPPQDINPQDLLNAPSEMISEYMQATGTRRAADLWIFHVLKTVHEEHKKQGIKMERLEGQLEELMKLVRQDQQVIQEARANQVWWAGARKRLGGLTGFLTKGAAGLGALGVLAWALTEFLRWASKHFSS